jgi:hypothetical protein
LHGGRWSEPENAESINSDSAEYYISFSNNGDLYFASSRAGGFGEEDLYVSKLDNTKRMLPKNLGSKVNTAASEYDPCISPLSEFLIFSSSKPDGFGNSDLYYSIKNDSMNWDQAHNLGNEFNTPTREYCPYLTPDGSYLFFSSEGNIKWIRSTRLKQKIK